jgi:endonuclease YncB( thermonuclease family)
VHHGVALGVGLAVLFAGAARADDQSGCDSKAFGTAQVRTVIDGRTLQLSDGREVRLAGIEVPEGKAPRWKARFQGVRFP